MTRSTCGSPCGHNTIHFQIALTCTQIWWTTEVGLAFARLEEGYENAIKDYNKKQVRCGPAGPSENCREVAGNLLPTKAELCQAAISADQNSPFHLKGPSLGTQNFRLSSESQGLP